ncbi:MAG: hypothetical protein NZM31_02290 [Gemmatales bacterium]|nr:hypothetical protein [Gemmatales bacterium]MDW8385827.1 hypothetical protein [Gemmatales bacterium]
MRTLLLSLSLGLVGLTAASAAQDDARAAALAAFKTAVESGSVKDLAPHVAGKPGQVLRRLAEPYAKARTAAERFETALAEKNIALENPFAASVRPLADLQVDVLEITKDKDRHLVRVRFGPRGRTNEEVLGLVEEEGAWRVTLPAALAKDLEPALRDNAADQRARQLETLSEILDQLARDVSNASLKTRDDVLLRLLLLSREKNLIRP